MINTGRPAIKYMASLLTTGLETFYIHHKVFDDKVLICKFKE